MNNLSLYAATVLIWGSTWLVMNYQLGPVPTEVSVVYRYAIAVTLLFGWALLRGLRLRFGAFEHLRFAALGVLLFGLNYILTYKAQLYIPSALNAVMFSTMMWMNVLNTRLFFGTPIEGRIYAGAALGLCGIVVMFWPSLGGLDPSRETLLGAGLSFIGAIVASLGNMVSHAAQRRELPIIQSNAWGMLYGLLFTTVVTVGQGLPFTFEYSFSYIASLLYLAIFGSIVAFGCYLKLLGRIGPHRAGYAMVMFPVVAVMLSIAFEGLELAAHVLGGIALVLAGNLIILGRRRSIRSLAPVVTRPGRAAFTESTTGAQVRGEAAAVAARRFQRKALRSSAAGDRPCRDGS